MSSRRAFVSPPLVVTWLVLSFDAMTVHADLPSGKEELGKHIFFDKNLSINRNQSCAACHQMQAGWTGPEESINQHGAVYEGSIPGRFGNRKPPSSAYATPSPMLSLTAGAFVGGNFWDGRATGEELGNPAADQAKGPFLNPLEQALPDAACVVYRVCTGSYARLFERVWGTDLCDIEWKRSGSGSPAVACACPTGEAHLSRKDRARVERAFDAVALSIGAFEASPQSNAFSSKYDLYLAGQIEFTPQERLGKALFEGRAHCANCHISHGPRPLFTDFSYDNLGVPRNPENPFYLQPAFNPLGSDWIDEGLGGFLSTRPDWAALADENRGKQKVPTLRNVDKRPSPAFAKAYGHNGFFKSLKEIVHFYNTRDVLPVCPADASIDHDHPTCWPPPEVEENVNRTELGHLDLTDEEEDAIVAFMKTLSDGFGR